MRPASLLTLAVLAAACASTGGSGTSSRPVTQTVRIDGAGSLNIANSTATAAVATLPFSVEQAWSALPAVYDSLSIPVTHADAAGHVLANEGLKVRARLGKTALSRYLDCGNTQMGPSADNYEITLAIATQLKPSGSASTTVETTLEATAKSIQFAQSATKCSSKGVLEPRVSVLLTSLLAAKGAR